ncbi:LPS assembly lipoprotein LptE [Methylopila sp. M107]|uniref:LPS assembly lipoprotein LptE n=1 Tax=Methylopila sp. M107 TaxID=1101190 RepID=UPI0003607CBA|nr:LPS assembly lipoprotein LptE [Methylopila sp. M107]
MWSFEARVLVRFALVGALALTTAGCFRPVYGAGETPGVVGKGPGGDVAELMRSVEVKPIDGRVGLKMRNELIFLLRGGGAAGPTAYRVNITFSEYGQSAVVDPYTSVTQSRTISLQASYTMTRAGGGLDPIMKGEAFATATYFSGLQRFANIRAERDAEDRAAVQIAERIRSRLQAYFAGGR